MPKPTFSRFLHKRQEQHSELSNGLVKTCRMERATGEIFVEMSENKGQKTLPVKKHYLRENIIKQRTFFNREHHQTQNIIWQKTLFDTEGYLKQNIFWHRTSSDSEHYLTENIIWQRTLSDKEHFPRKKIIRQQVRQRCRSQQRVSSPWSPPRSLSQRPRAGSPSEFCKQAFA